MMCIYLFLGFLFEGMVSTLSEKAFLYHTARTQKSDADKVLLE